jgi:hypothetical protein
MARIMLKINSSVMKDKSELAMKLPTKDNDVDKPDFFTLKSGLFLLKSRTLVLKLDNII